MCASLTFTWIILTFWILIFVLLTAIRMSSKVSHLSGTILGGDHLYRINNNFTFSHCFLRSLSLPVYMILCWRNNVQSFLVAWYLCIQSEIASTYTICTSVWWDSKSSRKKKLPSATWRINIKASFNWL